MTSETKKRDSLYAYGDVSYSLEAMVSASSFILYKLTWLNQYNELVFGNELISNRNELINERRVLL